MISSRAAVPPGAKRARSASSRAAKLPAQPATKPAAKPARPPAAAASPGAVSEQAAPRGPRVVSLPPDALTVLRGADPALGRLIDRVGPCLMEVGRAENHLAALVRAIVFQQLSGKAAATIYGRLRGLFGSPAARFPTPAEIRAVPDAALRACGLSSQKLSYLRDLCMRAAAGTLELAQLEELDDEAVIAQLTTVRGVGRWSAQMFLMFQLGRLDVWPAFDLGIRKGVMLLHGLAELPSPQALVEVGARYRPYCSVASWYLWRLHDLKV